MSDLLPDKVVKKSAIVVIDNLVTQLDYSLNQGAPLFGVTWGICKGVFSSVIELRQDRAIELIKTVVDNTNPFSKKVLSDVHFQDGFVYIFEKYIRERSEYKRVLIKNVLFGFASFDRKEDFNLERILVTLQQVSVEEIKIMETFYDGTILRWHKQQFPKTDLDKLKEMSTEPLNLVQISKHILFDIKKQENCESLLYTTEKLAHLASLGLIIAVMDPTYNFEGSRFQASDFGHLVYKFIIN